MFNDLVQVKENKTVTTSLLVAEKFNKQHSKVMRAIENLIEGIANFGDTPNLFRLTYAINKQNGVSYPIYEMNRDGFTLLAMGFTGKDALEWKLKYIEAFNAMEEKLKTPVQEDNRLELARMIVALPTTKLKYLTALYPEYFSEEPDPDSLEYYADRYAIFKEWLELYDIDAEFLTTYPSKIIFNNYLRFCEKNGLDGMGKKTFYQAVEREYNFTRRQKSDGGRYFMRA